MRNKFVTFTLFFTFMSLITFAQDCEHISRYGDEKPKGYYFGNPPNPFSPTSYTNFGLPDTSKISIKIYDVKGISVYSNDCRLAGGDYKFDWGFLVEVSSGVYTIKMISDLDRTFKSGEMHFEGSNRIVIVK